MDIIWNWYKCFGCITYIQVTIINKSVITDIDLERQVTAELTDVHIS